MKYSQMMEIVLYPRKLPALLAVASATLILVAPAQAFPTNIYLNSPITPGASTDVGHVGWTLLDSLSWGAYSNITFRAGQAGSPNIDTNDIGWTQGINTNVQALQNAVSSGTHQARTQFDVVQAGNPLGTPYLSLATEDHVFTSVHVNGQIVIASSSFGKVKLTYDPAARGETGLATSTTWNPKTNIVESGSKTLSPTLPLNGAEPAAVDGKITAYLRLGNSLDGIAGNSWAAGYENWIQLDGTSWDLNLSPETFYSSYYPGRPTVFGLAWKQQINATLPVVLANLASGRNLSQATLEFVKLGAAGPVTFMQVNMNQFRFDYLSFRESYDDSSMNVSVDFATMSQTSWEIRPDGTRGAAISFGHNYILGQPMSGALAYSVANFGTGNLSPVAAVPEPANIGTISFSPNSLAVGGTTTASATASSGLTVTFNSSATPTICSVSGSIITGVAAGTCTIAADQAGNATYSAAPQVTQNITVNATARLINLSTRGQVQTGDNVMIGGFIIGGTTSKKVLVRAVGPNLANYGVAGVLLDPSLQLFSGQTPIASNDDWGSAINKAEIQASGFAPVNGKESAILGTLNPGAYTAIVSGMGGGTGVGIVEVYELDQPQIPLINISTRGKVLTGDNVMIGGFIIQGDSAKTVLIRAVGPNLLNYGVTGVLANPKLQLYSGQTVIASNDDWGTSTNAADITATGLAPVNPLESAILITLQPGAYTAIVSGADGGTGVGIIEVFAQ